MSGWIKMGVGLRTHPKVIRMASAMKADKLRIVGALHAVWCVFDEHSKDGTLPSYTLAGMDDVIGWRGFGSAMAAVGWLVETEDGLSVPDYEAHNGPTAKRRATETKRKSESREAAGDVCTKSDRIADWKRKKSGHLSASDADTMRTDVGHDAGQRRGEENRKEEGEGVGTSRDPSAPTRAGQACLRMRALGLQAVSPSHPKLLALLDAGITDDELAEAAADAVAKGKPFAYALATAEGRRRDAAATPAIPAAPKPAATAAPDNADFDRYRAEAEALQNQTPEQRAASKAARDQALALAREALKLGPSARVAR